MTDDTKTEQTSKVLLADSIQAISSMDSGEFTASVLERLTQAFEAKYTPATISRMGSSERDGLVIALDFIKSYPNELFASNPSHVVGAYMRKLPAAYKGNSQEASAAIQELRGMATGQFEVLQGAESILRDKLSESADEIADSVSRFTEGATSKLSLSDRLEQLCQARIGQSVA